MVADCPLSRLPRVRAYIKAIGLVKLKLKILKHLKSNKM